MTSKAEDYFADPTVPLADKIDRVLSLHNSQGATDELTTVEPDIITHGMADGLYIRGQYYPRAGNAHDGHAHDTDHLSIIASGAVMVYAEGQPPTQYLAGTMVHIAAHIKHRIVALRDNTSAFCVFNAERMVEAVPADVPTDVVATNNNKT